MRLENVPVFRNQITLLRTQDISSHLCSFLTNMLSTVFVSQCLFLSVSFVFLFFLNTSPVASHGGWFLHWALLLLSFGHLLWLASSFRPFFIRSSNSHWLLSAFFLMSSLLVPTYYLISNHGVLNCTCITGALEQAWFCFLLYAINKYVKRFIFFLP